MLDDKRRQTRERRALRPLHRYLSFGGGVNSTALMLWLLDQGIEHEAVYADVGADWPETREYVEMLKKRGYPVTILDTRRKGMTLTEWCLEHAMMPSRMLRWCTSSFKVDPLARYFEKPGIIYIGIDAGEVWRAKPMGIADREYQYPLVEAGIDRSGCEDIIKAHGLPVPGKSHCYFCPFQRTRDFRRLRSEHPELYCKARQIEELTNARLSRLGEEPMFLTARKPLGQAVQREQLELWEEPSVRPCLCEV